MAPAKPLVTRSDKMMSGAVVFAGTRVPAQTFFDYLEEGDTLDEFLKDFPTVGREHAIAVLELAGVGAMSNRFKIAHSDPNILGGSPVFVGTRVPLQNLIDCLEAGDSIDNFLKSFPSVSRDQVIAALEIAREALEASGRDR